MQWNVVGSFKHITWQYVHISFCNTDWFRKLLQSIHNTLSCLNLINLSISCTKSISGNFDTRNHFLFLSASMHRGSHGWMLYIHGSCLYRSITSLLYPSDCSLLRSGYDGQRNLSLCYYHFNINTNFIPSTHLHSFHILITIFMDITEKCHFSRIWYFTLIKNSKWRGGLRGDFL